MPVREAVVRGRRGARRKQVVPRPRRVSVAPVDDGALALPVLDRAVVRVALEDLDEPLLDLLLRAELEAPHAFDDLLVELVCAQRLAVHEVRVGRAPEAALHPGVGEDFRERRPRGGVGHQHASQKVFALFIRFV